MEIDSCYQVGYVIKQHGIKGEIKIHLQSSLPKKLESIFFLIEGRLVPFFLEQVSTTDSSAILKLEDVETHSQAKNLVGKVIFVSRTLRPKSKKEDENPIQQVIGFKVVENGVALGKVVAVHDHEMNPLLVVSAKSKELLIPINDHFIKRIDKTEETITVELPDGFLDI